MRTNTRSKIGLRWTDKRWLKFSPSLTIEQKQTYLYALITSRFFSSFCSFPFCFLHLLNKALVVAGHVTRHFRSFTRNLLKLKSPNLITNKLRLKGAKYGNEIKKKIINIILFIRNAEMFHRGGTINRGRNDFFFSKINL